jgi:hypothetical protein
MSFESKRAASPTHLLVKGADMPRRAAIVLVLVSFAVAAAPALAGRGGGKTPASASCVASGTVVHAQGLPTDQVINFLVTDAKGTTGWVLGFTPDGTWSVDVASPTGPTTYQFVSKTWGPDGSKYTVFASCTA